MAAAAAQKIAETLVWCADHSKCGDSGRGHTWHEMDALHQVALKDPALFEYIDVSSASPATQCRLKFKSYDLKTHDIVATDAQGKSHVIPYQKAVAVVYVSDAAEAAAIKIVKAAWDAASFKPPPFCSDCGAVPKT